MWQRGSLHLLRNMRQRGGHGWPGGSFWSEGTQTGRNGYLFGETPPLPGQARKWESWEFMTYTGFGIATIMAIAIAYGPDHSMTTWSRNQALKELEEEDVLFERFASDADFRADVAAKLRSYGKVPERYYDAVMSRKEYFVLKQQHEQGSA